MMRMACHHYSGPLTILLLRSPRVVVGMVVSGRRCQVWALLSPVYYYELGVKQQIVSDSVGARAVVTLSP